MTNSLDVKRAAPPPNWYRDRSDPSLLRYWDGTRWTDHTSPVPSRDTATPQAQADTDEVTPPSVVARDTVLSAYLASGSFSLWDREDRSTAGVRAADDMVSSATPGESSSRSASATDAIEDASATGDDDAVSRLAECSYCYGSVHPTARKCMHCGEFLDDALKAEREHEAIV